MTAAGQGGRPLVLCLHESGTSGRIWKPLATALEDAADVEAPDRIGWAATPAPEGYARTTIAEQAGFAEARLLEAGRERAIVCGAGIGACVALELLLRRPELVGGAILVEPPLISFSPGATEQLSADAETVRETFQEGGREAVIDVYLEGRLGAMGPGAERIPEALRERGPVAARAFAAEIGAVPAWETNSSDLVAAARPSLVVTGEDTPAVIAAAAAGLVAVLGRSQSLALGPGLPHHDCSRELADAVLGLAARTR